MNPKWRTSLRQLTAGLALAAALLAACGDRALAAPLPQEVSVYSPGSGAWLGVSIAEVTPEVVREKKLPAERGVLVREVEAGSPAEKAGLKAGDVITEYNRTPVEGTVHLQRLVRETPAGRKVQLTVWREGRAQQLSAELAGVREQWEGRIRAMIPETLDLELRLPPSVISIPRAPVLGVSTDDLSGQLGEFFGAPEGEGVLVREVRSGSPAEKAGLKAGDVIVKVDGHRVRNASELRQRLRAPREAKSVALGVIRNRAETTISVEIEPPPAPARRTITSRRAI